MPRGIMINFERLRRVAPSRWSTHNLRYNGDRPDGEEKERERDITRARETKRVQRDANTKIEIRDVSDMFRFASSSRTKSRCNDARRYSTLRPDRR